MHLAETDSLYLRFSSFASAHFPLSLPARILGSLLLRRRSARLLPAVPRLRNTSAIAHIGKIVDNLRYPAKSYSGVVSPSLGYFPLSSVGFANYEHLYNAVVFHESFYKCNRTYYFYRLAMCILNHPNTPEIRILYYCYFRDTLPDRWKPQYLVIVKYLPGFPYGLYS
jgi:hypothetical protein